VTLTPYQQTVLDLVPVDQHNAKTVTQLGASMYRDGAPHAPPITNTLYKLMDMGLVKRAPRGWDWEYWRCK
jgi:hypothetical protein